MDVRPKITVDLTEYDMTGEIVMEPLTFRRDIEMRNAIGACMHYEGAGDNMKVSGQDVGSILVHSVLGYITQAPFKISYEGFMNFMDRCDRQKPGLASEVFARLQAESKRIKEGDLSPFGSSGESPTGTSESN